MATDQPGVFVGPLDPGNTYGKCFLDVSYAAFDTEDDIDLYPEKRIPNVATLTLTPNVNGALLGPGSQIILVTPKTLTTTAGHFEFWCIDGNHSSLNPSGWNWNARLTVDGATINSFNFSPDSTTQTPVNLGTFFPLTDSSTGTVLLPGPPPSTSWVGDQLLVGGVLGPHLTGPAGSGGSGGATSYNDLTDKPALKTVATTGVYADLTGKPTLFSGSYVDLTNKPTLFSGSYTDLTNRPTLAAVATSGSYTDLINKPTAFSGSYTDLTNKPTIPAAQVQTDWNATTGLTSIANKPTLAPIATSGSYNDLSSKPSVLAISTQATPPTTPNTGDLWADPNGTFQANVTWSSISSKPTFSTVATSGSYNDLSNKPTYATLSGAPKITFSTTAPASPAVGDFWGNTS